MSKARLNLGKVSAILVDSDRYVQELVAQMLRGFGLDRLAVLDKGEVAKERIQAGGIDLCILEANLPDMTGFDLVRWVRRLEDPQIRFLPVVMLTGYTQATAVAKARDCGANVVIRKPVSPQGLFDRISWVSRNQRPFVECEAYIGPDRRFKSIGPPSGVGRRSTDLSAEVGTATAPNMSQDEIDMLFKPAKVGAP
jgi:DNA-binding response OmpR family regulator